LLKHDKIYDDKNDRFIITKFDDMLKGMQK